MREMQKVRIWNPEKNEFEYSGGTPMMQSSFFKHSARCLTVHNQSYEYSTGLKDKNGKEIYEGDIIKMMTYLSYEKGKENKYRLEIAKSGCPCGLHTNGMVSICEEGQEEYTPQMEIIGNIH